MSEVRSRIAHLYRRAAFGARPDELDALEGRGYEAAVETLLGGLTAPDTAGDQVPLPALPGPPPPGPPPSDPAARLALARAGQQAEARQLAALQDWWLGRMIVSSTPLREKLTLLWSGHFATGFAKVQNATWMHRQNELFRGLGAGSFEALTLAVARDPAMQLWLDTDTDVAAHPNENFARELMELFTLGLGNYSEGDVHEAARCFTGWSFNRATGDFVLRARLHDPGQKTLLGLTGDFTGDDVVHILSGAPACARFIVAKLWSHLASPVAPADAVVGPLASSFEKDLNITALLRAILLHPRFTASDARNGLVKQPVEYVVGVARALGLPALSSGAGGGSGSSGTRPRAGVPSLAVVSRLLGQEPFNPPNVGGWPQNEYWLTTATADARWKFAVAAAAAADLSAIESLPGARRPDGLARLLSIDGWGKTTTAALNSAAADPHHLVALALCAPEYVLN